MKYISLILKVLNYICVCRKAIRVGSLLKLIVMKKLSKEDLSKLKGGYECFMYSDCTLPKGLGCNVSYGCTSGGSGNSGYSGGGGGGNSGGGGGSYTPPGS